MHDLSIQYFVMRNRNLFKLLISLIEKTGGGVMRKFGLVVFVVFLALASPAMAFSKDTGGYSHPYPSDVRPGDIVIGHGEKTDWLIPGYWTHTGMIAYYDSSLDEWIVVESMPDPGVSLVTLSEFLSRYDDVAVLRVSTTDGIRQSAVDFAMNQLGKPYDYAWWTKQVYGDAYYCSELVWAAYIAVGGPDVDDNPGWSWTYAYGVAPQEVYDDGDTYQIYRDTV
jgi:uncharacterized protein YycO